MTSRLRNFIGRETELQLVERLVSSISSTHILFFDGDGGVGKTYLLQEIQLKEVEFAGKENQALSISELIECDQIEIHTALGLEEAVIKSLPEQFQSHFTLFYNMRAVYFESRDKGLADENLQLLRDQCRRIFSEQLNVITESYRLVILIDTLEAIQDTEAWREFCTLSMVNTKNTLFVLAGRRCEPVANELRELNSQTPNQYEVHINSLGGFVEEEAAEYWASLPGQEVPDDIRKKVTYLSQGRPILLLLSRTWLDEDIPLPIIEENSLVELERLKKSNEPKFASLAQKFEAALVRQVLDIAHPLNSYVLYMAHVWRRFNFEILSYLFRLDREGAMEAASELSQLEFVKIKQNDIIVLHDEMRAMVTNYAWPIRDPNASERQRISSEMVDWYTEQISKLVSDQKELVQFREIAGSTTERSEALRLSIEKQRSIWFLTMEQIYYAFLANPQNGFNIFVETFDSYFPSQMDRLQDLIEETKFYIDSVLTLEKTIQLDYFQRLYDYHEKAGSNITAIHDAFSHIVEIYEELPHTEIDKQIEFLRFKGLYLKNEDPIGSTEAFEEAIDLCLTSSEYHKHLPDFYNNLGLVYRLRGQRQNAIDVYQKVLKLDISELRRAGTLNNLAFVYSEIRKQYQEDIMSYWNEGFEIREKSGNDKLVAISWSTLGGIRRNIKDFGGSLDAYNTALDMFRQIKPLDNAWLGRVYSGMGFTYWRDKKLSEAESAIQKSIDLCRKYYPAELPGTVHRMGHVQWDMENIPEAIDFFSESLQLSKGQSPIFYVNSMCELAELAYIAWLDDHAKYHLEEIQGYLERTYEYETVVDCRPFSGRVRRAWADVLFDQALESDNEQNRRDKCDQALELYVRAYADISEQAFANKGLTDYWPDLQARLDRLPLDVALEWIETIQELWQQPGFSPHEASALVSKYPEMISLTDAYRLKRQSNDS
jgi:tetratricopeptide (TPR) repeat protein